MMGMVLIIVFGGFYETSFYNLMNKKTKKPRKRTDTVSKVKAKANKKQVLYR